MADLTIAEAAARLGVSKETLRTRVKRGKVSAQKGSDGQWRISLPDQAPPFLEPVHELGHELGSEPGHESPTDTITIPASGRMQLDALRDEWLMPLINRIGDLERENGRLEAAAEELPRERERRERAEQAVIEERERRRQAEQERDDLQRRIREDGIARLKLPMEARENIADAPQGVETPRVSHEGAQSAEQASPKQRWPWWMRLLGGK